MVLPLGIGIQVLYSAEDHSAVWDDRFPVSKYSRTSFYIAGHLPHLQAIKRPFPLYLSYHSTVYEPGLQGIFMNQAISVFFYDLQQILPQLFQLMFTIAKSQDNLLLSS